MSYPYRQPFYICRRLRHLRPTDRTVPPEEGRELARQVDHRSGIVKSWIYRYPFRLARALINVRSGTRVHRHNAWFAARYFEGAGLYLN